MLLFFAFDTMALHIMINFVRRTSRTYILLSHATDSLPRLRNLHSFLSSAHNFSCSTYKTLNLLLLYTNINRFPSFYIHEISIHTISHRLEAHPTTAPSYTLW